MYRECTVNWIALFLNLEADKVRAGKMDERYTASRETDWEEHSIIDLIGREDWEGALASLLRLQEVPRNSLLHVVLVTLNSPLELVKRLVILNPSVIYCKHGALHNTPLHHAVLDASMEVIQYLLEVDPSVVYLENRLQRTPIKSLLIDDCHMSMLYATIEVFPGSRENIVEIFQMLLKAMYPQFHQDGTFRLLNAAVTWIQKENNLSGTLSKHLMQLLTPLVPTMEHTTLDQFGNTPLHLACSGAIKQGCHPKYRSACTAGEAQSSSFCLIAYLVRTHPLSASVLHGDELPLHMVLRQTHFQVCLDALAALANAHPQALTRLDPIFQLYPFQLAACGTNSSLDATYYLLRTCPELERFVW